MPVSWPLPRGETRDMAETCLIHNSVVKRMRADPTYRPGNLIVGGGGRGVRKAPEEYGMVSCQRRKSTVRVTKADTTMLTGHVEDRKRTW